MPKQCFVISPIGDEGSEIRREADALLWVIRNSLGKFGFDVVRVDEIAGTATITSEIVQQIQEAELCVIVLTGRNPNVYYEAGRRHETGKPFIQMIRKGEAMPFDVAAIRTIIYEDIDSVDSIKRVTEQIQKFTEEFERNGYGTAGTGLSLSTIASAIDRLESKIGLILSSGHARVGSPDASYAGRDALLNPRQTFLDSIERGDLQGAASALAILEMIFPPGTWIPSAAILARIGHEPSLEMVIRGLDENLEALIADPETLTTSIASIVSFYEETDREKEGTVRIGGLVQRVADAMVEARDRAYVVNQAQKLHYGAEQYEEALRFSKLSLDLSPNDPAYVYNASLIARKMGHKERQLNLVDRLALLNSDHPRHVEETALVYAEMGRIEDARAQLEKLRSIDPGRAARVAKSAEFQRL